MSQLNKFLVRRKISSYTWNEMNAYDKGGGGTKKNTHWILYRHGLMSRFEVALPLLCEISVPFIDAFQWRGPGVTLSLVL